MLDAFFAEAVRWLVPALLGGVVTAIGFACRYGRAVVQAMRVLLRARLIDIHERYVIRADPCPVDAKEEADEVYAAYHSLGGNGTGTHLHDEIMDAHISDQHEHAPRQ